MPAHVHGPPSQLPIKVYRDLSIISIYLSIIYYLLYTKSPLNFLETLLSRHVALLQTLLNRHMALSNPTVDFHLNWWTHYFTPLD